MTVETSSNETKQLIKQKKNLCACLMHDFSVVVVVDKLDGMKKNGLQPFFPPFFSFRILFVSTIVACLQTVLVHRLV